MNTHPSRIVCLNAETAEILSLLGEGDRIAGLAGSVSALPESQHRKPRVSIQSDSCVERICSLGPDLVLGSGLKHGPVLASLAQRGIAVHLFNQPSVRGILNMIRVVGALVGREQAAAAQAGSIEWRIEGIRARSHEERRPRIYFEEWSEPSISASGWISELIEIAGGTNCFPELASRPHQEERIVHDLDEVLRRDPDIIVGSGRGKAQLGQIGSREGWAQMRALIHGEVHEIDAALIQQPGPVALTHGLDALHRIVELWRDRTSRMFRTTFLPAVTPVEPVSERVA